jgi:hypothetical protein
MSVVSTESGDKVCVFKGSAIRGSSLLNTLGDVRGVLKRGSAVLIDNVSYETSLTGDWTANSVQLTTDYSGETNFSVTIFIPGGSVSPKKKKGGELKSGKPATINSTVEDLDAINGKFAARLGAVAEGQQAQQLRKGGVHRQQKAKGPPPPLPHESNPTDNDLAQYDDDDDDDDYGTEVAATDEQLTSNKNRIQPAQGRPPRKLPPLNTQLDAAPPATTRAAAKDSTVQSRPKSRTGVPQSKPSVRGGPERTELTVKTKNTVMTPKAPAAQQRHRKNSTVSSVGDDSAVDAADEAKPVLTETALVEQRRLAAERVKRKLKEDQERVEREAARKEAELKAQHEASVNKARELQARTAARVEQHKEEKARMEAERKAIEVFEKQQREQVNQQYLNAARFQKMKEIRREAKQRYAPFLTRCVV